MESPATEIKHQEAAFGLFAMDAVRGGCCRGLIDEAFERQPCELSRTGSRSSLAIVELGWNGDHSPRNRLAEKALGIAIQADQHESAQFLRQE